MASNMIEYTIGGKPGPVKATRTIVPIPKPAANEVLIKVIATDSNPKDWKASRNHEEGHGINQGDDISGIVESVGSSVWEFAPGDRVCAFHRWSNITAREHDSCTCTLPELGPPLPWKPAKADIPILIYGGASAVGAYALKFAKLSGLTPIITVAGNGIDFVKSLNAADHIIDYRNGNVVEAIQEALNGRKVHHAFDAVSYNRSYENIVQVLQHSGGGQIDMVDPPSDDTANPNRDLWKWPEGIKFTRTFVSSAYGTPHKYRNEIEAAEDQQFAYVFYRYISSLLADERLQPHPFEVLPNGLESVAGGIQSLYDRKVSAQKLVYR
ncbi:hypothetical protein TrVFT333_006468 [Trichoderma virens FT-333]|nr:hypothetical protein TrVFT333_006468 [Trichoderma virens FT-333]